MNHSAYSVVSSYAEDRQLLTVKAVNSTELAALMTNRLEMPILLDEFNFALDDEFARPLGVAMLNLVALGQPNIKQYMSVTPEPISDTTNNKN
ncbi:hypothetical protein [Paraburkholderia humisilvae]|uniref:Uncharacterized protein n=1 Tax=Paraburkholderia humisilvae TaxID=627669 RepID=A0A6J5D2G1_9BURK|nr:hypothetical protein [Paraburkholderia humisilvae]CAB3747444.1 hypothetical protein LMG29542_00460 [Paraburkholderia humisilvae]